MLKDRLARLDHYRRAGSAGVRGWLDDLVFEALVPLAGCQEQWGIAGAIYEIGVYEGRFLLALECLRRPGEALVAIDIFGLPVASEGPRPTDAQALLANLSRLAPGSDPVTLVEADSSQLRAGALRQTHGAARLISIDGDHAPASTLGDLLLAEQLLAAGGVVLLDDCFNPLFPGVQEGLARYRLGQAEAQRGLVPFAYYGGKLLLTDLAHHPRYLTAFNRHFALDQVRRRMRGEPGFDARLALCWGHPLLVVAGWREADPAG